MTRGGPLNSTLSVALLMYEQGFRWWHMGYAAAIAFVLFVVILAATTVQVRLREEERGMKRPVATFFLHAAADRSRRCSPRCRWSG